MWLPRVDTAFTRIFPFAITAEMNGDLVSRIGEFYDTRSLVS